MPKGKRGDGKLHITFNEMGHGDNVAISLPNGKLLMIDCGSMRWDGNFWSPKQSAAVLRAYALDIMLNDKRLLLNNKEIDVLILTHPDRDHCSELVSLFYPGLKNLGAVTKIKKVYFSESFSNYGKHGVTDLLWTKKFADEIYSITVNQDESKFAKLKKYDRKGIEYTTSDIEACDEDEEELFKMSRIAATRNFVKIMDGTADRGVVCGVYILASNVRAYDRVTDNSSQDNRGSIVTVVVYGDKKFLFMGDSTINTEKFLFDTYGERIKNVEMLHIPHHCSYSTSSSTAFVNHVNPRYAAITAAYDAGSHLALPRYEIIDRYHKGTRMLVKPDETDNKMKSITCYQKQQETKVLKRDSSGKVKKKRIIEYNELTSYAADNQVWCTGSHGAIDFDYEQKKNGSVDQMEEETDQMDVDEE